MWWFQAVPDFITSNLTNIRDLIAQDISNGDTDDFKFKDRTICFENFGKLFGLIVTFQFYNNSFIQNLITNLMSKHGLKELTLVKYIILADYERRFYPHLNPSK